MRFTLLPAVAVLVFAACAPSSMRPTLAQLRSAGYLCGDGVRDNVPSGLFQWQCRGLVAGTDAFVDVDGNDAGVAEITLMVKSTDPAVIAAEFRRLSARVAPLGSAPALADALGTWTGRQVFTTVGRARVERECDVTQCYVEVVSVDGPLTPLLLP